MVGPLIEVVVDAYTDPRKKLMMVKTDTKKVPSPIFLHVYLGAVTQLFTKKEFPLHNPFKNTVISGSLRMNYPFKNLFKGKP